MTVARWVVVRQRANDKGWQCVRIQTEARLERLEFPADDRARPLCCSVCPKLLSDVEHYLAVSKDG